MSKEKTLIFGIVGSVVLLILFFLLQTFNALFLKLDSKWLIVAGVPIVVALIAGGYISKFKGFGIELETLLQNPIEPIDLVALDAAEELDGMDKRSLEFLENLPPEKKDSIQRLTFNIDRQGYYDAGVVNEYIGLLPNLQYIELKDNKGMFYGVLPIVNLKRGERRNFERVDEFVNAIRDGKVLDEFRLSLLTERVKESESLIDILPKTRESRAGILPVVNNRGRFLGLVTTEMIEKKIVDKVLLAQKKA